MKQTAVQWLVEELGEYFPHEIGGIHLMVEQAIEMEKEQIKSAWNDGRHICGKKNNTAEEYYNETYETQND